MLYSKLGAKAYLAWLRGLGVRYVVLSSAPPDYSARAEAALLASGRAGLQPVFFTSTLTIYAVPQPRSIVTGPDTPKLVVAHAGADRRRRAPRRRLPHRRALESPYWRASDGCLREGKDQMLRLQTRAARHVTIVFQVNADSALDELAGAKRDCSLGSPSR